MDPALAWRLRCLVRQLARPPQVAQALAGVALDEALQRALLALLDSDPVLAAAPLRQDYRQRLLKHLISTAEQQGHPLSDELVESYTEALSAPAGPSPAPISDPSVAGGASGPGVGVQWRVKTYTYAPGGWAPSSSGSAEHAALEAAHAAQITAALEATGPAGHLAPEACSSCSVSGPGSSCSVSGRSSGSGARQGLVSLRVSDNMLAGGTGCIEWEAGLALAEFVLSRPELFADRACLELGSGPGLLGVTLHRMGMCGAVLLTDGDAGALANCGANLRLNGVPVQWVEDAQALEFGGAVAAASSPEQGLQPGQPSAGVLCTQLHWEDGPGPGLRPDVVLGSDLLYDPYAVVQAVKMLGHLLVPPPCPAAAAAAATEAEAGAAAEAEAAGGTAADGALQQPHGRPAAAAGTGAGGTWQARPGRPVAYLATILRQETTHALFLSEARAAGLEVEDISTQLPGAQAAAAAAAGAAAAGSVRFQHCVALDEATRQRVMLHRVQAANVQMPAPGARVAAG